MYDVIIVGAGPAGLTAAIYAARRELKTLVVSKDLGGQATLTNKIQNYPGIEFIAGVPLMSVFKKQAAEAGAEFLFDEVKSLEKKEDAFVVATRKKEFEAKSVILSFGLTPRDLGVDGEDAHSGDTVFHEVTEHGPRFVGKDVAVIGGGNSAFDSVVFLEKIARRIYLIHRSDAFRGEEVTLNKIKEMKNVEFIVNSEVQAFEGEPLEALILKNTKTEEETRLEVSGACVNIGYNTKTDWVGDLVERTNRGHIIVNRDCETITEGLFAAGDCTDVPYKQIITSGGEGCKAAMKVYEYIATKEGRRAQLFDWT